MNPGVYIGMDRTQYDEISFFNQTLIKRWRELGDVPSDFAYWNAHRGDGVDKECLLLGSALDCLVLEAGKFDERFIISPKCDRRTTVGKQTWANFQSTLNGRKDLTYDQFACITSMANAICAFDSTKDVFMTCKKAVLIAKTFGTDCKGEVDLWEGKTNHIWDLKAIRDVSQYGFGKAFCDFGYDIQAVFYMELARTLGFNKRVFNFVCVKNSPPYSVQVHSFAPDDNEYHAVIYAQALGRITEAIRQLDRRIKADDFRDDQDWRLIEIPAWRLRQAKYEMEST